MGVNKNDIISFEMTCKFSYKNCDMTVKRHNNILVLTTISISGKGYIIEKNNNFIVDSNYYDILKYLNKNIAYIEEIYQSAIKKGVANNSKIRDFEEYGK